MQLGAVKRKNSFKKPGTFYKKRSDTSSPEGFKVVSGRYLSESKCYLEAETMVNEILGERSQYQPALTLKGDVE